MEEFYPRALSGAAVTELPPALIPARRPLTGTLVTLVPQDAAQHAEALYAASHGSPEGLSIWDYLPYGPWPTPEAYAEALRQQTSSFETIFYSICAGDGGAPCGQASYLDIHPQNGVIEIGHIWFAPALQRSRAATEALFLMLCYAMDELRYRRMQWRCNALNERSRAAARRLGFGFEGIFHNHLIFKGKNRDTAWYSILDDEWPEVREIIAAWLRPDNFDAEGRAKGSLGAAMAGRSPSRRRP